MKTHPFLRLFALCGAATVFAYAQPLPPSQDRQSVRIHQSVEPVFPPQELAQGITTGRARVIFSIDSSGALEDWLVVGYTKPAFAAAAAAAIRQWTFEPLRVGGEAVSARCELNFDFQATGAIVTLDANSTMTSLFQAFPSAGGQWDTSLAELDRVPARVEAPAPRYSSSLSERGITGQALIEFFIDEKGAVRMPAVIAADHEELGILAAAAVATWKFEPPLQRGRPVITRARQVFRFEPGSS